MLLSLSNCSTCFLTPFSLRLNEAQREEVQGAKGVLEVNYISFILFCYVQFDLSDQWYILRDLQHCAPRLTMEEAAGFRSHGAQHCQGSSASVLTRKAEEDICLDCLKRKMVIFMDVEIIPAG